MYSSAKKILDFSSFFFERKLVDLDDRLERMFTELDYLSFSKFQQCLSFFLVKR